MKYSSFPLAGVLAIAGMLAACDLEPAAPDLSGSDAVLAYSKGMTADAVSPKLQEINAALAAAGAGYAIEMAEISLGPGASIDQAQTLFAFDRNLRLSSQWVPGDSRRLADGANITYMVDQTFALANASINAEPSIDASFSTWNNVQCANLDIVKRPDDGQLHTAVIGIGDPLAADVYTLGFLPGFYFDAYVDPGASQNVLGVTFTAIFGSFDSQGNFTPSDIDNNHRTDTALKEVWYNDDFLWSANGAPGATDIETVAFHENGHALELDHFGRVAINSAGKFMVSPRAAMNAFILGVLRGPLGTDTGAYCGNWASWPN